MKVVILAGGLGTRLSEETQLVPKPMVEIGGRPILWHIMKIYSHYGLNEFVILTGYKSHVIKEFFVNYYQRYSDITVDLTCNSVEIHRMKTEPWKVTMLYTGLNTMTGSRLKQAQDYIRGEDFCLTYGDGVSDVDISEVIRAHRESGRAMTITAVKPSGKFGAIDIDGSGKITSFREKPDGDGNWINGGFMVCSPKVLDYLPEDRTDCILEREPIERIAADGLLGAFKHGGFWHSMDTLKDKNDLASLWASGNAPWAVWLKGRRNG